MFYLISITLKSQYYYIWVQKIITGSLCFASVERQNFVVFLHCSRPILWATLSWVYELLSEILADDGESTQGEVLTDDDGDEEDDDKGVVDEGCPLRQDVGEVVHAKP